MAQLIDGKLISAQIKDELKEEVAQMKWATCSDILKMKKEGTFIPYHDGFIEMIFSMRKKRGAIS